MYAHPLTFEEEEEEDKPSLFSFFSDNKDEDNMG